MDVFRVKIFRQDSQSTNLRVLMKDPKAGSTHPWQCPNNNLLNDALSLFYAP